MQISSQECCSYYGGTSTRSVVSILDLPWRKKARASRRKEIMKKTELKCNSNECVWQKIVRRKRKLSNGHNLKSCGPRVPVAYCILQCSFCSTVGRLSFLDIIAKMYVDATAAWVNRFLSDSDVNLKPGTSVTLGFFLLWIFWRLPQTDIQNFELVFVTGCLFVSA